MKYKTAFISDLHLGATKSQVDLIYKFLKENEFENLYLVGDIIDIWRMKSSGFLNPEIGQKHVNIIQRLLKLAKKGTHITYIIGNHDEFISHFINDHNEFGNIHFCEKTTYITGSGKKYIVIHGHQFDLITQYHPWIAKLGDNGYEFMIWLNHFYNSIRTFLGMRYWSLSKYIKVKVKKAASFISNYENAVAKYASDQDCYGIICGHLHHAEMKFLHDRHYINTGCWTDLTNCDAVVEKEDGELHLISFGEYCILKNDIQSNI